MRISAVIITFNEEHNIAEAIRSVEWADEVLVVDSESTDRTRQIAQSLGARVMVNPWPGFSVQKQFAAEMAEHDWIFSLDADERASPELRDEIAALVDEPLRRLADGYRVPRLSYYVGRPIRHGGWYPDLQLRLFDRRKGHWNGAVVHESVAMDPGARIERLDGDILHFTVESYEHHERMIRERYAPLGARKMLEEGRRSSLVKASLSSLFAFVRTYFLKLGFLDGGPGFRIARLAARNTYMKHRLLIEMRRSAQGD